jgi:hypothetical protein
MYEPSFVSGSPAIGCLPSRTSFSFVLESRNQRKAAASSRASLVIGLP